MKEVITIGLDLAKQVFQVHGVDGSGEVTVRRTVTVLTAGLLAGKFFKIPLSR